MSTRTHAQGDTNAWGRKRTLTQAHKFYSFLNKDPKEAQTKNR